MATTDSTPTELDIADKFLRRHYEDEIAQLAERFPSEQKSLEIDWMDLFRYDPDLADDYLSAPGQLREYLEEAVRLFELPIEVDLTGVNVRVYNVPESYTYPVGAYRSEQIGSYIAVEGQVQKQTEVHPNPVEAAFECNRCETMNRVPQIEGEIQEPHECKGCERQGPFRLNADRSDWTDVQLLRLQLPPEQTKGGTSPTIDIHTRDDLVGTCQAGDRLTVSGTLTIDADSDSHGYKPELRAHEITIQQTDYEDIEIEAFLDDIRAVPFN